MTPDKSDKAKALDLALSHIERQFGRGSLMRLGAAGALAEVAVIPTGSLALDAALRVGGIPRGRITEIYGPEYSGKTTLALHVIAEAQRAGASKPLLMLNMPWIPCMPVAWGFRCVSRCDGSMS